MARIFMDGFESGNTGLWAEAYNVDVVGSPPTGMSGIYYAGTGSSSSRLNSINFATSKTELYFAFKFYLGSGLGNGIIQFYDSDGTAILTLMKQNSGSYFSLLRLGAYTGTLLSTGTISLNASVTHLIEIYYKPLNSNGVVTTKINGIQDISYSGDTTLGLENINSFALGAFSGTTSYGNWDDVIVDDANWIGNTKIQALVPTGAGATNLWDSLIEQANSITPNVDFNQSGPVNLRFTIAAGELTNTYSSVRLRLVGHGSQPTVIGGCSIGERSGLTDDFAVTPTRVTFNNGQSGVTISAIAQIYSDTITFTLDETKDYLIHFYLSTVGTAYFRYGVIDIDGYYETSAASDNTMIQSVSYTKYATIIRRGIFAGIQSVLVDSAENYSAVDETPASDVDYIKTSSGQIDTYQMGNLTGYTASIKCVAVQSRNWREGNGTYDRGQHIIRPASTDRLAAAKTSVFPISPAGFQSIWELNPEDSAAWEETDVNGMEAGIKAVEA